MPSVCLSSANPPPPPRAPRETRWVVSAKLCNYMLRYPPPRCRSPPLVVPRGGGGASLGQPKIFPCGSLCCCVGDCVVGHYHLHPLHSWQDILLTFAEMELDSTTMFPAGTSVMFIRSTEEPVLAQLVGHSEHGEQVVFYKGHSRREMGSQKFVCAPPSLLPRRQNHHPRVLPKAFQWKVESMCKSSR